MKENEKLLAGLGGIDDDIITEAKKTKKRFPARLFAIGGICAAAVIGVFALNYSGAFQHPDFLSEELVSSHKIYPEYNLEPTSDELITLNSTIEFGAMGFEGLMAYDISELDNGNPWNAKIELSALPVFRNLTLNEYSSAGVAVYLSEEEMTTMAENAAACLGISVLSTETDNEPLPLSCLTAVCDGTAIETGQITIDVYGDGRMQISFSPELPIPNGYSFTFNATSHSEAMKTLQYFTGLFRNLLQFDRPVACTFAERGFNGDQSRSYCVYNDSDDYVEKILNYNFCQAGFGCSAYNNTMTMIWLSNRLYAAECVGNYPIISAEAAQSLLLDGSFITSVPSQYLKNGVLSAADIKKVELSYRPSCFFDEYYQPYYRFYVELSSDSLNAEMAEGLKTYGIFYVPAVSGEYLSDFPVWDGSFN